MFDVEVDMFGEADMVNCLLLDWSVRRAFLLNYLGLGYIGLAVGRSQGPGSGGWLGSV